MLWKCCTQYVSKFWKFSSGHRTGKGQFSFQSQRKTMPKNAQTTAQLHSSNPRDGGAWWAASLGSHRVGHDWRDLAAAATAYASKVMLKILQARLQQYVNREIPDDQAGFRKGRGTRVQIANIHWIIEKAREFQKNIYFWMSISALVTMPKPLTVWITINCGKFWKRWEYEITWLPLEKPICRSGSNI